MSTFQRALDKVLETLTSRRLWAAVAASIPFALANDWVNFALVWGGYAGLVGAQDVARSLKSGN